MTAQVSPEYWIDGERERECMCLCVFGEGWQDRWEPMCGSQVGAEYSRREQQLQTPRQEDCASELGEKG